MDIDFPDTPCDFLSVEIQDEMALHWAKAGDTLKKIRLGVYPGSAGVVANAAEISPYKGDPIARAKEAFKNGEGCSIKGFININKGPGQFSINSNAFKESLEIVGQKSNFTHVIKYLSFGRRRYATLVGEKFEGKHGEIMPLNGHREVSKESGTTINYKLDLTPALYQDVMQMIYPISEVAYDITSKNTGEEAVIFNYTMKNEKIYYYQIGSTFFQMFMGIGFMIGGALPIIWFTIVMVFQTLDNINMIKPNKAE